MSESSATAAFAIFKTSFAVVSFDTSKFQTASLIACFAAEIFFFIADNSASV